MMNTDKLLVDIVDRYKRVLGDNLVGLYLHGSLAMGCFTPRADIDLIAVVRKPMDNDTKRALIDETFKIGPLPEKGLEMSIILEEHARDFIHPMPFELHYSPAHKERYEADRGYICGGTTDRDLAAHLMVVKRRGVVLYGKSIEEVFGEIPKEAFIDSIIYNIGDAKKGILKDPMNITLDLCRTLYYLKQGIVASKIEGGYWCTAYLPEEHHPVVADAVKAYIGSIKQMPMNIEKLSRFAEYMLTAISIEKHSLIGL